MDVAESNGRLVIPTEIFPRACGKTHALRRAAEDIHRALFVTFNGVFHLEAGSRDNKIAFKHAIVDGETSRGMTVDGARPIYILDDGVSYMQLVNSPLSVCNYVALVHDMDVDTKDRLLIEDERIRTLKEMMRNLYQGENRHVVH